MNAAEMTPPSGKPRARTCCTRNFNLVYCFSPDKIASFFSKLTFFWYDSIAWIGYRRQLTPDDLWPLNRDDSCSVQYSRFDKEVRPKESIWHPIARCYGATYGFALLLKLVADMLVFVQPELVRYEGYIVTPRRCNANCTPLLTDS